MVFDRERIQMCIGKQFQHIIQNKRSNDIRPRGGLKNRDLKNIFDSDNAAKTANKTTRKSGNMPFEILMEISEKTLSV
jgi:hypothetical protein